MKHEQNSDFISIAILLLWHASPMPGHCLAYVPDRVLYVKDDQTEENTFEILQHSDRNINNS